MNITKEQLRQIIKEEISEMMDSSSKSGLDRLVNHENPEMIMSGIEMATILNMPIKMYNKPPRQILKYIEHSKDSNLLTLMSDPENSKFVLFRVAANQNTPIEVIYKIATDESYNIRASNIAKQSLKIYCDQHPDDKICDDVANTTGYRN